MPNVTLEVTLKNGSLDVDQSGNGNQIAHGQSVTITLAGAKLTLSPYESAAAGAVEIGARKARDVSDVAGNQRNDAGREE